MKNLSYLTVSLCLVCALDGFGQYTGKRENLGSNINSEGNTDSAPVVTYDGKTMFFKRSVPGAGYDYDIYFSTLDANNQWTMAQPLKELNNDKVNEVEYVYPDGKKMILCGTYKGKSGLFHSSFDNGWKNPEYIDLGKTLDANNDNLNVALNSRQNVMIISIHGDLFVSFKEGDKWGEVKEIKNLNTSGYEYTPFLDYDDKTLFIAGTGYPGSNGEADIFRVTRTDESWLNWSSPEKVSGNINTDGWDSFFYIPPSKDYVYVYNLNEGDGDILRIRNQENPQDVIEVTETPAVAENILQQEEQEMVQQLIAAGEVIEEEEAQAENAENRAMGDNQLELENILVYPNPTKGQFNMVLHNGGDEQISNITILDANLKTISSIATAQGIYSFDISGYENGIYFIRISCNGKDTVKKIVLEK